MRYMCITEAYSAVKKNEIMENSGKQIDLKTIKVTQAQTQIPHVLCHVWIPASDVETCLYVPSEHVQRSGKQEEALESQGQGFRGGEDGTRVEGFKQG